MKYFDYAATTYCEDSVIKAMEPYWNLKFGNAHSRSHAYGWAAEEGVEKARKQIAKLINANEDEIIFTSGATESNNLAIKGYVNGIGYKKGKKLLTLITEHKCVIETMRFLKRSGYEVEFLPVLENGLLDLNVLNEHIKDAQFLSISYVNNETGVIQDIPAISKICRQNNVVLHVDAAQAFGKIQINAREVDLLSISAHKIYGPKGVGALFVSKLPRIRIASLFNGGGQERNLRSGTIPVPLCVGFGVAAEIAMQKMEMDFQNAQKFSAMIINEFVKNEEEIYINGSIDSKIPHILNLSIPYVEGESLIMRMKEFAVASGSACTSKSLEPSHVISAMHVKNKYLAHSSLRICFGRATFEEDINELIIALKKNIKELRELSPLWSMFKKGIDLDSIKWKVD